MPSHGGGGGVYDGFALFISLFILMYNIRGIFVNIFLIMIVEDLLLDYKASSKAEMSNQTSLNVV